MSERATVQTQTTANLTPTPMASGVVQRACACGNHTPAGGACVHCRNEHSPMTPRAAIKPGTADEALRSSTETADRSFARVPVVVNITDPDPERAAITHQLLRTLSSQLGLPPDAVEIRVDAESKRRVEARGAHGLMHRGVVYLDPQFYRPRTPEGRYLLGHEVAHVVQRNNSRSLSTEVVSAKIAADAETEADQIGRTLVSSGAFLFPRVALPAQILAANTGIADVGSSAEPLGAERKELNALVARLHQSELARIMDLLSYGIFDWAVTDEDVRKVLTILQTFDMVTARSLVVALPSKHRNRLLNNLDTDHYKGQRTQVLAAYWGCATSELRKFSGELRTAFSTMELRQLTPLEAAAAQYALQSMAEDDRKQLLQGKKADEIEEILAFVPDLREEEKQLKEALEREEALQTERRAAEQVFKSGERAQALQDIVKLIKNMIDRWWGHDRRAPENVLSMLRMLVPYLNRKIELRAIADQLEKEDDYLDKFIRHVPVKALYLESNLRRVFLALVSFRAPYKNEELAEDLASTSWWIPVDSEDAYLAFLLVKAMPPHTRQAFFNANGGDNWDLVMEKMSQQQRESESLNLYTGGKNEADKNVLLSQLISDDVWGPQGVSRLDGLIRMAIAAGEHEFVFNQSKQREAYKKAWLMPLVEKFMLFDPNGKDNKGRPRNQYWPEMLEGTDWYERGLSGLVYRYGIQGLDFVFSSNDVEVATKSIGGTGLNLVELQDMLGGNFLGVRFTEFKKLGQQGKEAREKKAGVNFANVKWDTSQGILEMNAPKLALDAIRYPVDDLMFQAGRGVLESLNVILRYRTRRKAEPSMIDVEIGNLTLNDVMLISPDKMKGANTVGVSGVRIYAGMSGADITKLSGPRSGLKVPVPVVGLPLGAAWNVFLGSLWNGVASIFNADTMAGISGSISEMSSNLKKPTEPLEFRFVFNSLKLVGVTTSSGQFVESVELKNFVLRGGGDVNSYRRALTMSQVRIEERLVKARDEFGRADPEKRKQISQLIRALEQQHEHTLAELKALRENEKEVLRLEVLQKQSPKSFTAQDRMRLRRLKAQLTGAVLDVRSISIRGIAGVAEGEHTLANIQGQGRSVSAAFDVLLAPDKIKNLITGAAARPVISGTAEDRNAFALDIGHIELPTFRLQGAIPKAKDAREDFEKFESKYEPWRKSHQDELARLKRRAELAEQREALLADPGITRMNANQQTQFRQIERELDEIESKGQLTVGRVVMEGTALTITDNRQIAIRAEELLVEDIQKGNLQIRKIAGNRVEVGVDVSDGIAGLEEWRRNLQRIGIKGESVVATGIKNEEIGLEVDRATLMGIDEASLTVGMHDASARIATKMVLVEGVRLRNIEDLLIKERDYLLSLGVRREGEQKRLDAVQAKLDELAKLRERLGAAERDLAKAKTSKQKSAAQNRREQAQRQLDSWAEGLVAESLAVSDLDVDVLGLGDVLSEAYDPTSALDNNGIEVRGRGGPSGKRIFSGVTGTNIGIPGLSGSKVSVGETSGRITHSKAGTLLEDIHIDTIAAQGIDWRGGQHHAFSRGETRLQGIDVSAFIGEDQIIISKLDLGAIIADQLGYEDESSGLSVIVESGGLGGVRVTNLTITLPKGKDESAKITGKVVGQSLNNLKLNTLIKGIRAKGTLNGSNLSADFVTDRKRVFSIGDLSLRGGEILQPGKTNKIHLSFRGLKGAMTLEDVGKDKTKKTISGSVKEISGDVEGLGAKSGFKTGPITMSPIEISADGTEVKLADVEIKDINLTSPKYTDGKGTDIKLDSANVTAVHIKGVVAKFGQVTNKDGKKSQGMTNLDISGLKLDFIGAKGFEYTGKTTISSSQSKTTTIKADRAELSDLEFESLSHDFKARVTKLNAKLGKTSVTSFAATFAETISGKTSQTEVTSNIEAGSMHAKLTLTGTKAYGEDWTSMDGLFELTDSTKLGLTNMRVVGEKFELGVLDPKKTGGLDLTGLKVRLAPNGTMFVEFNELAGQNLKLKAGAATIEIPLAKLKKAAAGLEGRAPKQAFDLLGATLKELEVQGIKLTYEVDRSASSTSGGKPAAVRDLWKLDALGGLDGTLRLRAINVDWIGDTDVPAPIRGGVINFNGVIGDDGYWPPGDIHFGIDREGIYADQYIRKHLYDTTGLSGVTTEQTTQSEIGTIVTERGSLNLKEMLEGILNAPPSTGPTTPPAQLDIFNTLELGGELQLGEGVIGTSRNNLTLYGKATEKNKITISGARLGTNLSLYIPEFQATKGSFEAFGKTGETGQITANVQIAVTGLGSGPDASGHIKFTVTLTIEHGVVRDIKFGDVSLVSESAVRARPAPPKEK